MVRIPHVQFRHEQRTPAHTDQAQVRHSVLTLVLALLLVLLPAATVRAAVYPDSARQPAADPAIRPLLTGEYAFAEMAAGEMIHYAVSITEAGDYLLQPDSASGDPASFAVTITDDAGETVFEGTFADIELPLAAGRHELTFEALADDTLAFFLLGFVGTMTNSEEEPGRLYPGSIYGEEALEFERFAILTVPPTYPQEMLLYVETEPADASLFVRADGDTIRYSSMNSRDGELLRFWTDGGDILISVDPSRETSFTLIAMLGGPTERIELDSNTDLILDESTRQLVYQFTLDAFYEEVSADLLWDDPDLSLSLEVSDTLNDPIVRAFGSEAESEDYAVRELAVLEAAVPGTYYVSIDHFSSPDEPVEAVLRLSGIPGPELQQLEDGIALEGSLEADSEAIYRFDVVQANALVTVDLVAADEENTDFDINVTRQPGRFMASSRTFAASESLSFMAPVAGAYFVEVTSEEAGDYTVSASEGDLPPLLPFDEVLRGTVEADSSQIFRVELDDPERLLSIILAGESGLDIDLRVELLDRGGSLRHGLSSLTRGAYEIVSLAMPTPGVYSVEIRNAEDRESAFSLLGRYEHPVELFSATLTVTNNSQADLCELYVSPSNAADQQPTNRLEDALAAGEATTVTIGAGRYDLEAVDCDGAVLSEFSNAFLQGEMTWPVP